MSEFVVRIEPTSGYRFAVWISEKPYRGIETDSALGRWERQRVGGAWTSERLVGRFLTRAVAKAAGRTAIQVARRKRVGDARKALRHRRHMSQPSATITAPAASLATDPEAGEGS